MEREVDPLDPNYNYNVPDYEPSVPEPDNNPQETYDILEPLVCVKTEPELKEDYGEDYYQIVEHIPPVNVPPVILEEKKKPEAVVEPAPVPVRRRKRRSKLQMNEVSREVEDIQNTIPFYGCAVCDSRFHRLDQLQKHVTEHKGRITSWDLKVRNQKLRKIKKKALKKISKKIKIEIIEPEIKEEKIDPEYDDPTVNLNVPNCDVNVNGETNVPVDSNISSETILPGDANVNGETNIPGGAYVNLEINVSGNANVNSETNIPSNANVNVGNGYICDNLATEIGNIMMRNLSSNIDEVAKELHNIIATTKANEGAEIGKEASELNEDIERKNVSGMEKELENKQNKVSGTGSEAPQKMDAVIKTEENSEELDKLERIFKCGGCSKQFSLGYYLKLHVRSHTGEKPYVCQECGQTFITASKLGRHRKRTHLSVRAICRVCRRSYTRLEFLIKHFNKHHADDKIEGEPYDYNAILPYLKDLEEELQQKKAEEEKKKLEEARRFGDEFMEVLEDFKPKTEDKEPKLEPKEIEVKIEPMIKVETELKTEEDFVSVDVMEDRRDDDGGVLEPSGEFQEEDVGGDFGAFDDSPGNDVSDDEDYFPDNTWLSAPIKDEPTNKKKRTKTAQKSNKPRNKEDSSLTTCNICNKNVSSSTYLRIHMRIHTKEKPYKCHLCVKTFITSSKLNRHIMTHREWEGEETVKTEDAIKKEGTEDNENEDENKPEKTKKGRKKRRRKCPIPNRAQPEFRLGERVNKKARPRPHACEFCRKRFLYIEALQVHRRCHAGQAVQLHCGFCLEPCGDVEALRAHEARHGGPRPFLCTLCGRTYTKKETMIYHRRMHEAENKFQCDICPKSFNAKNKLQRHLLSHRAGKCAVRFECPVCAHCFNTRYHVEMHLATHEKEGVIQEENRGQVLAMVLQNARRIPLDQETPVETKQLDWGDERSRICNICGEIFMHFYLLEQHLKSHGSSICQGKEEEKKFICQVCNKGFKLSYYLKLHSFTHTKEKPFICQQCGKGFITRGKLKRHLETHAGLKKFQCHICCKFFTRPSYLRIHVRTIHGTQDYNFKMDNSYYSESLDDISMSHDSV